VGGRGAGKTSAEELYRTSCFGVIANPMTHRRKRWMDRSRGDCLERVHVKKSARGWRRRGLGRKKVKGISQWKGAARVAPERFPWLGSGAAGAASSPPPPLMASVGCDERIAAAPPRPLRLISALPRTACTKTTTKESCSPQRCRRRPRGTHALARRLLPFPPHFCPPLRGDSSMKRERARWNSAHPI
jgi:hypothetical protein